VDTKKHLSFFRPTRQFVIVNSTDEWLEPTFNGQTFYVPPTDLVVHEHPKYQDVPCSYRDESNELVPGTLVVSDLEDHGRIVFPVDQAIRHCLGIDPDEFFPYPAQDLLGFIGILNSLCIFDGPGKEAPGFFLGNSGSLGKPKKSIGSRFSLFRPDFPGQPFGHFSVLRRPQEDHFLKG